MPGNVVLLLLIQQQQQTALEFPTITAADFSFYKHMKSKTRITSTVGWQRCWDLLPEMFSVGVTEAADQVEVQQAALWLEK